MKSERRATGLTLADIPVGGQARVVSFSQQIPGKQRVHLQAYGLVPGRLVMIAQHSPVTVVQIEQMELALETDLAGLVLVEEQD
jgi:Fe2+ transport system protein FeoA